MCQFAPSGAALRQITRVKTIFLSLSILAGCGWDFEWCEKNLDFCTDQMVERGSAH
jgi:hypothetical protein